MTTEPRELHPLKFFKDPVDAKNQAEHVKDMRPKVDGLVADDEGEAQRGRPPQSPPR